MKPTQALLKEIAGIRAMERGTLCRMGSGPYFNHQTWERGRNRVRYVRQTDVPALREAIAGYRRFLALTRQYADLVVAQSRASRSAQKPPAPAHRPRRKN